jgi:hypothetical protein
MVWMEGKDNLAFGSPTVAVLAVMSATVLPVGLFP